MATIRVCRSLTRQQFVALCSSSRRCNHQVSSLGRSHPVQVNGKPAKIVLPDWLQ
jgi:hypothetical protein